MAQEKPELFYDHFDDVDHVGPFIDQVETLNSVVTSPEFQNEMVHFLTDAENTSPPDIYDPFGLTQEIDGPLSAMPMDSNELRVIENGRMPAPEALFRVNFFVGQLANWIFNSTEMLTPDSIKRVIQGLLQSTPLPPPMLRSHPDVNKFTEVERIKACLAFAQQVDSSKIFLPCEIAASVATDAFSVYQQLMEKYPSGSPELLGDNKSIMITEFVNQVAGLAMLDAVQVSVRTNGLVIPPLEGDMSLSTQDLVKAAEGVAEGSLRSSMQKEGKRGLSAETVRLVITSLHRNLSAFNSYVEFLDDHNLAVENEAAADAAEHARKLLCSYVWALWHVSGTSVLEAESHIDAHNIELTAERKEDLMIMKLLNLTFEDFKQPWSQVAIKIKANAKWVEPYQNPETLRNNLLQKIRVLRHKKKQIDENLALKALIEQQQALSVELNRLKKIEQHWKLIEKQGGLEARVRLVLSESTHLRSRDLEFFDVLAEIAELHPQCKIRVRSDISSEDLKKMLNILRDDPFDIVLHKRLTFVETQLQQTIDDIAAKMPEGVISYSQLETDIKAVEREIHLAEFVYDIKLLKKDFDADQAAVAAINLATNQNVFKERMKQLHGERVALRNQKEKERQQGTSG